MGENARYPGDHKFRRKKPQEDCVDILGSKFCRNLAISKINKFFAFSAEIQDGCQKWWENYFWTKLPHGSADTLKVENFIEIALSQAVSEINAFLSFMQNFKMATKHGGKRFCKNWLDSALTLGVKNFVEITLSRTIFEINKFSHFTQKFKMTIKNDRKMIFGKKWQFCGNPRDKKARQSHSILHCV